MHSSLKRAHFKDEDQDSGLNPAQFRQSGLTIEQTHRAQKTAVSKAQRPQSADCKRQQTKEKTAIVTGLKRAAK